MNAVTDENNILQSNFSAAVDFSVIGTYSVTIKAINEEGISSNPLNVLVHIIPKDSNGGGGNGDGILSEGNSVVEGSLEGDKSLPGTGQSTWVYIRLFVISFGVTLIYLKFRKK